MATTGPAVRAVLDRYEQDVARHRRWRRADRVVTAALAVGSVWAVVAAVLGVVGVLQVPWYLAYSPLPLLAVWLFRRQDVLDMLGAPGEPQYPLSLLEMAAAADAEAANPRPFGSVPPTMRVYDPGAW